MYSIYQRHLVLVHIQGIVFGILSYFSWISHMVMFYLNVTFWVPSNLTYFQMIPWFLLSQSYVLLIPKAVSRLLFLKKYL